MKENPADRISSSTRNSKSLSPQRDAQIMKSNYSFHASTYESIDLLGFVNPLPVTRSKSKNVRVENEIKGKKVDGNIVPKFSKNQLSESTQNTIKDKQVAKRLTDYVAKKLQLKSGVTSSQLPSALPFNGEEYSLLFSD
jgi:hypothetical protein